MTRQRPYTEKLADARTRILEYLRARSAERALRVAEVRRYMHGTAGEALIPVVLAELERLALIECVDLTGKHGMIYYREEFNLWQEVECPTSENSPEK